MALEGRLRMERGLIRFEEGAMDEAGADLEWAERRLRSVALASRDHDLSLLNRAAFTWPSESTSCRCRFTVRSPVTAAMRMRRSHFLVFRPVESISAWVMLMTHCDMHGTLMLMPSWPE